MEYNFISLLANIHNALAEISVRGDDAIRMAEVLQSIRSFVAQAQSTSTTSTATQEETAETHE